MRTASLAIVVLGATLLLTGCARSRAAVDVNALASPKASELRSYVLRPENTQIALTDLQFQEFAAIAGRALSDRGFHHVEEQEESQVVILLDYGLGEPQFRAAVVQNLGSMLVGRNLYSQTRHVRLTAVETGDYQPGERVQPVWSTAMWSAGRSADLREMFPVLIAAGMDYFGTLSGEQVRVRLAKDGERVRALTSPDSQLTPAP